MEKGSGPGASRHQDDGQHDRHDYGIMAPIANSLPMLHFIHAYRASTHWSQ